MSADPRQHVSPRAFLGGLLLVLLVGLVWALNPHEDPDPEASRLGRGPSTLSQTAAPSPALSPVPPPTTKAAALLAAAPLPESTTLQVLDAGGGRERRRAAVAALQALGYQVVSTASSRQDVTRTTIWFTKGNEAQAQALQARDPRFTEIEPNPGLSARVDLHLLIGPDW
ncbi:MAG: LytR C-terminal domain-containing protein [Egibacteraceae bacterium]